MLILLITFIGFGYATAQDSSMSFFLTSKGPGDGANLGGLAGADAHCQMLAESVGAGVGVERFVDSRAHCADGDQVLRRQI
jgi:hypothetical protein